jgi:hypothetical protein
VSPKTLMAALPGVPFAKYRRLALDLSGPYIPRVKNRSGYLTRAGRLLMTYIAARLDRPHVGSGTSRVNTPWRCRAITEIACHVRERMIYDRGVRRLPERGVLTLRVPGAGSPVGLILAAQAALERQIER